MLYWRCRFSLTSGICFLERGSLCSRSHLRRIFWLEPVSSMITSPPILPGLLLTGRPRPRKRSISGGFHEPCGDEISTSHSHLDRISASTCFSCCRAQNEE